MNDQSADIDDARPPDNRPLLIGLVFVLALLGLTVVRTLPPGALPADAPADRFSEGRARAVLERILGDEQPHPIGSEANAAVRGRVIDELRALGLEPEEHVAFVCAGGRGACGRVVNVIARIPGRSDRKAVLVSVHHDSVPAAPGASDAGSGVAAIIEMARLLLAGEPLERPVLILINDGEEAGLLGARAFVDSPEADEVFGVVNLEARGTAGPSAMFETGPGNAAVVSAWARESRRPVTSSTLYALYQLLPNDTDLTVFKAEGWPGLNFAFADGLPRYHTPLDELAHLDPRTFQHHGENALAAVRALASLPDEAVGGEDAVWLDLLSAGVVRWPLSRNWPLIGVGGLLWIAACALTLRRRLATVGSTLIATGGALLALLLAQAAGFGVVTALQALRGDPAPWTAHPGWATTATVAASVLAVLLVAALLAPRTSAWAWWQAGGLVALVLSSVLVAQLPGAAGLGVVPALCVNASLLIAVLAPQRASLPLLLLGIGTAAVPWLSIGYALHVMMGLSPPLAVSAPAGFLAMLLATAAPASRGRWLGSLLALVVTAATFTGACLVRPYSPIKPRHEYLLHVEDAETGKAWLLHGGHASDNWAAVIGAEPTTFADWPVPGDALELDARVAAATGATPPVLEILSRQEIPGGRRFVARFASSRGASTAALRFPGDSGLSRLTIAGHERVLPEARVQRFSLRGLPAEGVELTIELQGRSPVSLTIEDHVHAIPRSARKYVDARPMSSVPVQDGDRSIVYRTITLP